MQHIQAANMLARGAEQHDMQHIQAANIPELFANYDLFPELVHTLTSSDQPAPSDSVKKMEQPSAEAPVADCSRSQPVSEKPSGGGTAAATDSEALPTVQDKRVLKKRVEMLSKLDDRLFVVISGSASIHLETVVTELAVEASATSTKDSMGNGYENMNASQKEQRAKLSSFLQQLQPRQIESMMHSEKTEKMKSWVHHLSTLGFGEVMTYDAGVAALDSSTVVLKGRAFKPGSSRDPHVRDATSFSQVVALGSAPASGPNSTHIPAEVLCIDCPLYNMLTGERRMDKRAARLAMSRVFWWKLCNPDHFLDKVTCRVEDFKQARYIKGA
jgi:O6-methylguanine-DNA--protein-cysteine methyltransferase